MTAWLTELRLRRRAGADPCNLRYFVTAFIAAGSLVSILLMLGRRPVIRINVAGDEAKTRKVLLLSSNGRSGSTYLSELLTAASSVNFFEPLRYNYSII